MIPLLKENVLKGCEFSFQKSPVDMFTMENRHHKTFVLFMSEEVTSLSIGYFVSWVSHFSVCLSAASVIIIF